MMDKHICYCFGYTATTIAQDDLRHGKSTIEEKIIAAKKGGECQFAAKNPKGR